MLPKYSSFHYESYKIMNMKTPCWHTVQDAGCRTREGGPQPSTALSDISYLALSGFYFCLFPVTEEVQGSAVQFSGVRTTCWHMSHQNVHQWVWPVLSRGAELMSLVKSLMWDNMMGRCWLPQGLPFNQEIREIIFDSALRQWWQWQWGRQGVWYGECETGTYFIYGF